MFESFKRSWLYFVSGFCAAIGLSLLISALLNMFNPSPVRPEKPLVVEQVAPPRFVSKWQTSGLYLVTDTKTGKEYLWSLQGGLAAAD